MLLLFAAFAVGIAASGLFASSVPVTVGISLGLGLAAAAVADTRFGTLLIGAAFLFAGIAVAKASDAAARPDRVSSIYDRGLIVSGEPVVVTGTITSRMESGVDGFRVSLSTESISRGTDVYASSGVVRLFVPVPSPEIAAEYERLQLRPGVTVRVGCQLDRDDGFRDPGVMSRKTVLAWQDTDASGTVKGPDLVEVLDRGSGVGHLIFDTREFLTAKFRAMFSPQVAGVMIASLLGNKNYLDAGTAQVFREGGTFHILVISGLHITFIGGLAALFVGLFTRLKWVQFIAACSFLWVYTLAVGAEVPVVRASLMFTVLWFSYVIHRPGSLANALGACGLVLLAWRPADLFTPSFQLTFVSVGAIVLAGFPIVSDLRSIGEWSPSSSTPFPPHVPAWLGRFCETLYWNAKRWEIEAERNVWSAKLFKSPYLRWGRNVQRAAAYVFEGVLISLIVQAAMLPLVVHYFHRVTPVSVVTNLWAGVLIGLESFASLAAVLFSLVSDRVALPLVYLTEMLHWLLVSVSERFSSGHWLSYRVPVYSNAEVWLYAVYFAAVLVVAAYAYLWDPFARGVRGRSGKPLFAAAVLMLLAGGVIAFHPFSQPRADGRLHVEFLDVGQGDSIFITFPNGETMLVDGGGRPSFRSDPTDTFEPDRPSIGETVVSEFLWERGYSRIDRIVATHADADHIQGLVDVARNFSVGEAWIGQTNTEGSDARRFHEVLMQNAVPVLIASGGSGLSIGGVRVDVLNPPDGNSGNGTENNNSIVLLLQYGDRRFLLTGDIEEEAEAAMLANGWDLRADVVKVPHHGSRTSSTPEFVERTRPTFAVIPVGLRSMFGHPHKEVVERWAEAGSEVLTTGREGTIAFSTDGAGLVFETYVRNGER